MKFLRSMLCIAIGSAVISACSEKKSPAVEHTALQTNASQETAATAQAEDGVTLTAEVAAGGIATQYVAHFEQDKLTRIDETRESNRGNGSYEFYGARLLKYSGTALDSSAPVLLEFSMTGSVEKSQSGSGPVTDAQLDAIRSRGQLLRSHALAQRSTRSHSTH